MKMPRIPENCAACQELLNGRNCFQYFHQNCGSRFENFLNSDLNDDSAFKFLNRLLIISSCRQSPTNNYDSIDDSDDESFESVLDQPSEQAEEPATRRYPLRERKPRADLQSFLNGKPTEKKRKKSPKQNDDDLDKLDALYSWYKWSNCKIAEQYDKERNFFPQPGPSNLNYYEDDDIVGYYRPVSDGKPKKNGGVTRSNGSSNKKATVEKKTPPKARGRKRNETQAMSPIPKEWQTNSDNSDWEDDIHVQSIYEQSFAENLSMNVKNSPNNHAISPTPPNYFDWNESKTPKNTASFLDTTISTPVLSKIMESFKTAASNEANEQSMKNQRIRVIGQCKITPLENTPRLSDIFEALDAYKMPKMTHPVPHYSDPNDILTDNSKKEVGHTILQLHGNAIDDCEEFQSELNVNGLAKLQRDLTVPNQIPRTRNNNSKTIESAGKVIRKFFAREQTTKIAPSEVPPTHSQANAWLKKSTTKKRSSTSIGDKDVENPAKAQRQNSVFDEKNHNNNYQQKNSNDVKQNGSQKRDIVSELLSKTELTVTRITRSNSTKRNTNPQSTDANHVNNNNNNNFKFKNEKEDDHGAEDDDDVICLSDNLPTKQPATNSFSQVGRLRNRIHLK